jgi:hypothetical protein
MRQEEMEMNGKHSLWRGAALLLVAALAVLALGPAPAAEAGNPNPRVIPPQAHPYSHTYGEWAARYFQWVFAIPAPVNPGLDETGANCGQGQSGPVWFLWSTWGGTATRDDCVIPPGKAILFSPLPVECSVLEPEPFHGENEAELRACARDAMDLATVVEVSVDGVPVTDLRNNYRFESPLFTFTLPDNNLFQFWGLEAPAGTTSLSVADGFYVMLAPLPPGPHTIYGRGVVEYYGFEAEVTYHLTVGR